MKSFLLCMNGKRVQRDGEDRMLWTETKSGKFSVKSLYKSLVFRFFPNENHLEVSSVVESELLY